MFFKECSPSLDTLPSFQALPVISTSRNDPKFSDTQVRANSVEPDQTDLSAIPFASFGCITL